MSREREREQHALNQKVGRLSEMTQENRELVDMGLMTEVEAEGRDTFLDDVQEALRQAEPPTWAIIAQHGLDLIKEARRVKRIDELRRDWEAAYRAASCR